MSYSKNNQKPSILIKAFDWQCMQKNIRMFKEYCKFTQVRYRKLHSIWELYLQNDQCDSVCREVNHLSLWKSIAKDTRLLFLVDQEHQVKDTIFVHMIDQQKKEHQFFIDGKQLLRILDLNENDYKYWQETLRDVVCARIIVEKDIWEE